MNNWKPSPAYQKVVEANRVWYAETAGWYNATETCVIDARAQSEIEQDLDRVLGLLGKPPAEIRALDACGGSGNIAVKLHRRNVQVTLVDISPELLDIFRKKCAQMEVEPHAVYAEIGFFLAQGNERFHLIVFSSALHHLEDVQGVLALALPRLLPGGLLFTTFDSTAKERQRALTRFLLRVEYFFFKLFFQTLDVPKTAWRRIRRVASGASPQDKQGVSLNAATAGMLAEYYGEKGIDDLALVENLKEGGYEIVWHERYPGARFSWTRRMIAWLGDATSFKLLLRNPARDPGVARSPSGRE